MSVFIKICGLRSADDVAAAADAGADAIGFVFAASVRQVTPVVAAQAVARAPVGLSRVAVMHHPTNAEWLAVLDGFGPDILQTDAEDLAALDIPASTSVWPVYREGGHRPPDEPRGTWLYEGAASGTGTAVDWRRAARLARRGRMLLAGGLAPANVGAAIETVRPWGVDVSSGVESAPGRKDPALMFQFIKAARAAESRA
jgi:phosphoribosylanthranilate isomerase